MKAKTWLIILEIILIIVLILAANRVKEYHSSFEHSCKIDYTKDSPCPCQPIIKSPYALGNINFTAYNVTLNG